MEKEGLAKQEWPNQQRYEAIQRIVKAVTDLGPTKGGNFNHEALAFKYLPGKGCSLIAKRPIKKGTRGLPTRQDEGLLAVPHSFSLSLANSSTSVRNKAMEFLEAVKSRDQQLRDLWSTPEANLVPRPEEVYVLMNALAMPGGIWGKDYLPSYEEMKQEGHSFFWTEDNLEEIFDGLDILPSLKVIVVGVKAFCEVVPDYFPDFCGYDSAEQLVKICLSYLSSRPFRDVLVPLMDLINGSDTRSATADNQQDCLVLPDHSEVDCSSLVALQDIPEGASIILDYGERIYADIAALRFGASFCEALSTPPGKDKVSSVSFPGTEVWERMPELNKQFLIEAAGLPPEMVHEHNFAQLETEPPTMFDLYQLPDQTRQFLTVSAITDKAAIKECLRLRRLRANVQIPNVVSSFARLLGAKLKGLGAGGRHITATDVALWKDQSQSWPTRLAARLRAAERETLHRWLHAADAAYSGGTNMLMRKITPVLKEMVAKEYGYTCPERCCENCGLAWGLSTCGRCKSVSYCGRACQRAHWPAHKLLCDLKTPDSS